MDPFGVVGKAEQAKWFRVVQQQLCIERVNVRRSEAASIARLIPFVRNDGNHQIDSVSP